MRTRLLVGSAFAALFLALVLFGFLHVAAAEDPPGPDRFTVIVQKYTSYEWWLTSWTGNTVVCIIDVDHEGLPTGGDIVKTCGEDIYNQWVVTKPCPKSGTCDGYYLQMAKSFPAERKVGIQEPPPVVWVTLNGCETYHSTFRCDSLPSLVLTGEEPLQGEHITHLGGKIDGKPFTCDPVCQVDLVPTDDNGSTLQFWAYSSYGDSSEVFQARVRVVKSADPTDQAWYTDVLSTQWRGDTLAGCSLVWDKFPPVGGTIGWLTTPQTPEDLATNAPYTFLAGSLITHNLVDASSCEAGGLLSNGFANACGLDAARPAMIAWQNRYDSLIFSAARQTGVPAPLLKNIFSKESQFWPGTSADHPEAGLGQMTEGGADVVLTWNPAFYEQFCPSVLDTSVCKTKIYPNPEDQWHGMGLDDSERSLLRGALIQSVDAVCPNCSIGVDLKKADFSVGIFAQTLLASCKQTGEVIDLNYTSTAANSASYEDLWRFTLVNYNAGPGCLGLAVDQTSRSGEPLDWEHLSSHLTPACQGAIDYVNDVSIPVSLSSAYITTPEAPPATEVPTAIPTDSPTETPTP